MQADKAEPAAGAAPASAAGKPPSFCDRLQKAFHARPAFRPLRRLTVRHEDGGGAAKPAGGAADGAAKPAGGAADGATSAAPGPAPKHSGPPLPVAPRPLTKSEQPVPVRLPAVTSKVAAGSAPTGPPVPLPPPDVVAGMATPTDAKAGEEGQQSKGKTRVGTKVRKALSSK